MSSHPFVFPYIGLGLRDDASIRRYDGVYAFVPAMGLARVHLPMPTGSTLPPLPVGALAAHLGLAYGADPIPRPGLLLRWGAGRILPTPEHRVPDELRRPDLVRFSVVEDFDAPGVAVSVGIS